MGTETSKSMLQTTKACVCSVLIAIGLPVSVICLTPTTTWAADAQTVSSEVAVHLKKAQKALTQKEWPSALAEIDKADAIKTKTSYDQQVIDQMRRYLLAHGN